MGPSYDASKARREAALAELAELELAERRGELVPADAVEARFASFASGVRLRMLGAAGHARQYLPARLSREDVIDIAAAFDRALREKLEEAARAAEGGEL